MTRSNLARPTRLRSRGRRHSSPGLFRPVTRIRSSTLSTECTRLSCKCQICFSTKTRSSAVTWVTSKRSSCTPPGLSSSLTCQMDRKSSKVLPSSTSKKCRRLLTWRTCACDSLSSVKRSTERFQACLSNVLPKVAVL